MFNPDKVYTPTFNEIAEKNAEVVLGAERKKRIQETDFVDNGKRGYTNTEVKRDLDIVQLREQQFRKKLEILSKEQIKKAKENKKRGEALEVIIAEKGEEFEWFGFGTKLSRTSKHDDIRNGVDAVAEFVSSEKTTHRVALAVDASMNPNPKVLKEKIDRNIRKIINEKDRIEVKYFKSAVDNFKGKLLLVFPVVVGLEGKEANDLIALFSEIIKLQSKEARNEEESEKLMQLLDEAKNHPCQIIYLKEIRGQLNWYKELFEDNKSIKTRSFQKEIDSLVKIIDSILDAKKDIPEGEMKNDGVYRAIKEIIKQSKDSNSVMKK